MFIPPNCPFPHHLWKGSSVPCNIFGPFFLLLLLDISPDTKFLALLTPSIKGPLALYQKASSPSSIGRKCQQTVDGSSWTSTHTQWTPVRSTSTGILEIKDPYLGEWRISWQVKKISLLICISITVVLSSLLTRYSNTRFVRLSHVLLCPWWPCISCWCFPSSSPSSYFYLLLQQRFPPGCHSRSHYCP